MRLYRSFGIALAVLAAGCEHDEVTELIARDGATTIPIIDLNTAAAGGFPGGPFRINRYLLSIDTSIADVFVRSSATPATFRADVNAIYGATPLVYGPNAAVATFNPPTRLLPAIVPSSGTAFARAYSAFAAPNNRAIAYIVSGDHPGNGASGSWEFWYALQNLTSGTRYVMGLARYALQQRGSLDHAEILIKGTVAQPDSLVFRAGDFNPGGNKAADNGYINDCANPAEGQPVAGANPFLIGGEAASSGAINIDHTICAGATWDLTYATANSPVPPNNNTGLGANTYNFLVVWEALADSTPNYAKPVFRQQIGPLIDAAGNVINNSYAPMTAPSPPGVPAAAQADTLALTVANLMPLTGSVYSVWLAERGTGTPVPAIGKVIRMNPADTTSRDTLFGVSEFATVAPRTTVRAEVDFAAYATVAYNAMVIAVGNAGAATIPQVQPVWVNMTAKKASGAPVPSLTGTATFGTFNGGTSSTLFGAAGTGTGGIYGTELREDIKRIPRPPLGYQYEAWLVSSTSAAAPLSLGPILSPYPDLQPLTDADVSTDPPLSGVEITQAAVRYEATDVAFYCDWDRVQVRVVPKSEAGSLPPTIVLSGTNPRRGC